MVPRQPLKRGETGSFVSEKNASLASVMPLSEPTFVCGTPLRYKWAEKNGPHKYLGSTWALCELLAAIFRYMDDEWTWAQNGFLYQRPSWTNQVSKTKRAVHMEQIR